MRARPLLLAVAAGFVVADASIVTLALPDILRDLHTTVEGVAAVIGVYTIVIAATLLPAERFVRHVGPATAGAAGFAVFGAAAVACASAGSLGVLLAGRAVQALGGAAGLIAVFVVLVGHAEESGAARRLWLYAAVLSAAVGPALGGALTQAFSWQAIFVAQVPVALLAIGACLGARPAAAAVRVHSSERFKRGPGLALGLVSAALTAVLFLLVLLLVAGWSVSPLRAAAAVTVIPLGALIGARIEGDPRLRACAGCALVGLGTIALAFLPDAHLIWTLLPQAFAGLGMGLALPALGGELLPERDARDAARLLTIRHVGIAVALVVLAPVVSARLDDATFHARERGVALALDARLPPQAKLALAPALLSSVEERRPRAGLKAALAERRSEFSGAELKAYDELGERADDTLVTAVGEAFWPAFLITGVFALLAALALSPPPRPRPRWALATAAAAIVAAGGYVVAHSALAPEPVAIRDPCAERPLPHAGGITGFVEDQALRLLDSTACRLGSSREELVLAFTDDADRRRFKQHHHVDPRSLGGLIGGLIAGG